ncbi:ATP-binding protein [Amaricoccus macauensis]|uniref:ATP-binding protein n=1 Tax=Amaricoccus macauensis TaxID=57001 RepID=UPI003C7A9492
MSFRLKTILGIALIELTVMAILISINQFALGGSATTQLFDRTDTTARVFANTVAGSVIATDLATLDATIESAVSTADLTYIRARNAAGVVLSEGGDAEALARLFRADTSFETATADHVIDISVPITIAGTNFGALELGMSTLAVEEQVRKALNWNIIVAVLGMSLVAVFGYGLGTILTKQLRWLREGARRISSGDLETRVTDTGRDELAETARCFNQMAEALSVERAQLRHKQEELLQKKARVDVIVECMTGISRGENNVDIPDTEREDEIGDMARATVVFDESMRAVRQARLEQQRLISAFDQVAEQVAIFELDGKSLFLNAAFRSFNEKIIRKLPYRFTLEQFLKEGISQGAFPDVREDPDGWIAEQLNRRDSAPLEMKRNSDRILLTVQSFVEGIGVVLSAKDITDLRRSEGQLIQASKMATLGEMATGIAHELNQPLGVIRMASSNSLKRIAKGHEDIEFYRGKFERIEEQTERAAQIINHMRVFGRKADGEMAPFDLGESLRKTTGLARTQLHTMDISLTTDIPDDAALVVGEQVIFEQVLLNLFSNARDAIESQGTGSGEIHVSAAFDTPEGHVLRIKDTGGGVPDDLIHKLFEPFFTTKEPGKGTGLGLSISFGTIREMSGEISVSNAEAGACFTIRLPRYEAEIAKAS